LTPQAREGYVNEARPKLSPVQEAPLPERLLSARELAEVLGTPVEQIWQMRKDGVIPVAAQVSPRRTRFRLSDVIRALNDRARETAA
jgi:predicted DNA-binding transcriptional regulator AlpA